MTTSASPTPAASLPVAIIGAGPIGLAAAANAAERGMDFVVLEAGPDAGAAVGEWAHVRLFSSWSELVDPAAAVCSMPPARGRRPTTTATRPAASGATRTCTPWRTLLDGQAGGSCVTTPAWWV